MTVTHHLRGVLVDAVDARLQAPIVRAARDTLDRSGVDRTDLTLEVAVDPSRRVLRLLLRSRVARALGEHTELGGELARALGVRTWSFVMEPTTGRETIVAWTRTGKRSWSEHVARDRIAVRLGIAFDDPRLVAALPLARLARELDLDRDVFQATLPSGDLPLDREASPGTLARLLGAARASKTGVEEVPGDLLDVLRDDVR